MAVHEVAAICRDVLAGKNGKLRQKRGDLPQKPNAVSQSYCLPDGLWLKVHKEGTTTTLIVARDQEASQAYRLLVLVQAASVWTLQHVALGWLWTQMTQQLQQKIGTIGARCGVWEDLSHQRAENVKHVLRCFSPQSLETPRASSKKARIP